MEVIRRMKAIGYTKCTLCGYPAVIWKSSNHKYKIKCDCCGCHTRWGRKKDVTKDWRYHDNVKV